MSALDLIDELHRYSVGEYEQLVDKGAFEDQRVELIEGLILDMSPKSPAHENAIEWLTRWFVRRLDPEHFSVRVASSLRLHTSVPEPDLAVVDRERRRDIHPLSAYLAIEVAHSSRKRDLTIKPRLYAPAVAEYWVLDLEQRRMVVHRDPASEVYRDVGLHGGEAMLTPGGLEIEPLPFAELLGAIA